jgi:DNA-binding HxlR family transcriptional regulator
VDISSINCPVEMTMQLIGDKWKVLIIAYLLLGNKRFNKLKNCIGDITQSVLIRNLKALETCGLIKRIVYQHVPPKVEYSLTDLGASLKPVIDTMEIWGRNYGNLN